MMESLLSEGMSGYIVSYPDGRTTAIGRCGSCRGWLAYEFDPIPKPEPGKVHMVGSEMVYGGCSCEEDDE